MDADSSGTSGRGRRGWHSLAERDWLAFDRADFVGTKVILSLAVVGTVLFGLLVPMVDAIRNSPLPVSYTTRITGGLVLPRGATHDGFATMDLLLKDATSGERLMQSLPGLMGSVLTIAVCWMLFRLLRSIQAGEPFTRANVRRINVIALIGEAFRRGVQLRSDVEGLV